MFFDSKFENAELAISQLFRSLNNLMCKLSAYLRIKCYFSEQMSHVGNFLFFRLPLALQKNAFSHFFSIRPAGCFLIKETVGSDGLPLL